jgi:lipoprotein-anchoring transpeptidase ErfK/SrfK
MLRVTDWPGRALALGLVAFACPVRLQAEELPAPAPVVVREAPVPAPVAAPERPAPSGELLLAGDGLRTGQYRWHPETAPAAGPVTIVVSLPLQRAWVFRGGVPIGVSTVSNGQPGYDTPTGAFRILEKDVDHHSSLYDDAPMPFMQRLTWDGVALHGGQVRAEPASHGCVRLPRGFARHLFGVTAVGGRVVISDEAPASAEQALALASGGAVASAE